MGFIDPLLPEQLRGAPFPFIFNVTHAVGRNCPNLEDDVKLVHFLLIEDYKAAESGFGWTQPKGEIDFKSGTYSAATENWITKFQIDFNFGGRRGRIQPTAMDKRVDRIRNKDNLFQGSLTKTTYTLAALNFMLQNMAPLVFISLPLSVPVISGTPPPASWDVVSNSR